MAANYFNEGTSGSAELIFERAVDYVNLSVATGATASFSLDGTDFITIPAGFHSFKIGPTKKIFITATGVWQMLAVQG